MMTKDERIRFYKSKEWQTTRKRVLERDNYECQQCKRDGKLTTYDKSKRKSFDVRSYIIARTSSGVCS